MLQNVAVLRPLGRTASSVVSSALAGMLQSIFIHIQSLHDLVKYISTDNEYIKMFVMFNNLKLSPY